VCVQISLGGARKLSRGVQGFFLGGDELSLKALVFRMKSKNVRPNLNVIDQNFGQPTHVYSPPS
jgi:hypothetical protein